MRLARAAPEHDRGAEHHAEHHDEHDGQAPQVAPPGGLRPVAAGGVAAGWRGRKRCRRQVGGGSGGRPASAVAADASPPDRIGVDRIGMGRSRRGLCQTRRDAAREAPVEAALRRGHHLGAVHRLRRLRHRLPPRRHRLRRHRGRLQAVPPRGGARPGRLHPRREGLHVLHPGLPPLPGLGARGRRAPLRPRPRAPTSRRASTRTSCSTRASRRRWSTRSARTAGSSRRILIWALEHDYIDAALVVATSRATARTWKAMPGVATHHGGDPRVGRQPLHLLGQHAGLRRGHRAAAPSASRSSA